MPQELIYLQLVRHLPGNYRTPVPGASPTPGTVTRPAKEGSNHAGAKPTAQKGASHTARALLLLLWGLVLIKKCTLFTRFASPDRDKQGFLPAAVSDAAGARFLEI